MKANDMPQELRDSTSPADGGELLSPLLQNPGKAEDASLAQLPTGLPGVVLGELLAIAEQGRQPLVRYPGQPGTQALPARTTVDLQGQHIGQTLLLVFNGGDPLQPIVMGVLRGEAGWPLSEPPAQVQVDAEGQRLIVSAKEQLVLRCGKASITLTKAGKVLIEGSYVSSRSSGVNRVKGGSVQLN